jgi:HEAT repeat protein
MRAGPEPGRESVAIARAIALALAVSALCAAPAEARAQGKRPAPAAPAFDVKALERRLQSGDAAQALMALAAARDAGPAAAGAAPAIEDVLRRGATAPIMKAAIEALGALGQPSSSAPIRPYVWHRMAELRREAARALAATKGSEAVAALREGLRSSDGMVRGLSAAGLGGLGAAEALPDLFAALDRDVTEAAASIGQLCDPAACRRLLGQLGAIGFDVITSGLDPILFRVRPLPEDLLLEIVQRVRNLGTPEAGRYLADVASRWPAGGSPRVKEALAAAVASIPGAGS